MLSVLAVACQPGVKLGDLSKIPATERDEAEQNWERVQKAFKAEDHQTLERLVGRKVLILVEASGSPRRGKALSVEERAASSRDTDRLAGTAGERATEIAKEMRERRDRAWQIDCRIDFTGRQVRDHFIWPDAVFSADFALLGTLTKASISGQSIRIKPVAIQPIILQL